MAKRILVTGGTGYIGSHTVVALQNTGYEVVVIDNLSNSEKEVLDGIAAITGKKPDFYEIDMREREALKVFFKKNGKLDGVIHFAAFKAVGESVEKPLDYYYNNIVSLLHLMEGMKEVNLKNLVFSSSCTVYGQPAHLPVTEDAPTQKPASPYGNTKKISEEILEEASEHGLTDCISLRYFNPIGAHASAKIGELPLGVPNNLVPFITQTAIGKRESLTVFGSDYPTPDGTCIRDYIHVMDLAEAHVIAMERLMAGKNQKPYEVFNLGTGKGYSVLEVITAFEKVSGKKLNYKTGPRRSGDVTAVYADTHRANRELGWSAKRDLEDMLLSAWNWEKALKGS